MDVSIILVSYNTKDLTRDCLNSVYEQTKDIEFEIFVVDNNSHDGSPEMIEKEFPNVRLIKNPDNKGFGAANNIAIRESKAKYVFCLNTDTILLNNAVKILYDYMESNPDAGACGGQLFDKNMGLMDSAGNYPTFWRTIFTYLGLRKLFPNIWENYLTPAKKCTYEEPTPVQSIIGADLFLRKSVLDEIGLFDENIFMYGEESDLCFRITRSGRNVMFVPDSKIIHIEGGSSQNLAKQKIIKTSLLYWYKKNRNYLNFLILKFFICTSYIIKRYPKDMIIYMAKIW